MKRLTLLAVLLLCVGVTGCSLMPDTAIGKWTLGYSAPGQLNLTFDFELKADGTGAYDAASVDASRSAIEAKAGVFKQLVQPLLTSLDQMKTVKITWKKKDKHYELTGLLPGPASSQTTYLKLDNGQATLLNADGSPSKPTGFTLAKKKQ